MPRTAVDAPPLPPVRTRDAAPAATTAPTATTAPPATTAPTAPTAATAAGSSARRRRPRSTLDGGAVPDTRDARARLAAAPSPSSSARGAVALRAARADGRSAPRFALTTDVASGACAVGAHTLTWRWTTVTARDAATGDARVVLSPRPDEAALRRTWDDAQGDVRVEGRRSQLGLHGGVASLLDVVETTAPLGFGLALRAATANAVTVDVVTGAQLRLSDLLDADARRAVLGQVQDELRILGDDALRAAADDLARANDTLSFAVGTHAFDGGPTLRVGVPQVAQSVADGEVYSAATPRFVLVDVPDRAALARALQR